jgi:hypothetical protein
MTKVSVDDRGSLERLYPKDAFASDAAWNELPNAITRGARVASAPDKNGSFEVDRASRHAGEPETPYFLAPQKGQDYGQFLDDIVTAAVRFGQRTEETPGQGDPRIKGFRGG